MSDRRHVIHKFGFFGFGPIIFSVFMSSQALGCISDETTLRNTLAAGQNAALCQSMTIYLTQPLMYQYSNQQIYTDGSPSSSSTYAILALSASSYNDPTYGTMPFETALTVSRNSGPYTGLKLQNVIITGRSDSLGMDGPSTSGSAQCAAHPAAIGCGALIEITNATNYSIVQNIIELTRSWSHLHLSPNNGQCSAGNVSNNSIGPAASPSTSGWGVSDGISLDCPGTTVSANTVHDVTDGGIVIFPEKNNDVTVANNTIMAVNNDMGEGIGLVDWNPGKGDNTQSNIYSNLIQANGRGEIHVAIPVGPRVWFGSTYSGNFGAAILNNTISGNSVAFGIVLDGGNAYSFSNNSLNGTNQAYIDQANSPGNSGTSGFVNQTQDYLDSLINKSFAIVAHYRYLAGATNPDQPGAESWLQNLNNDFGPTNANCSSSTATKFTTSFLNNSVPINYTNSLNSNQIVTNLYWLILDRAPDPNGLQGYSNVINSASSKVAGAMQVISDLYNSTEWQQNIGCLPNRQNPGPGPQ